MKRILTSVFALLFSMPLTLPAQTPPDNQGEVRKVDRKAGKITIKHGRLAKLDMDPMTMAFQVKDPAMLDNLKPGDKIRFDAEMGKGGAFTVTRIEQAK
jgi:Cu(I)/Ag(I) efflux system periplasmic protein CusF